MNMIIKTTEGEFRGPVIRSELRQPPIRAYMDDMTMAATTTTGAKWLLKGIEKYNIWARMSFNTSKSRSLFFKKKANYRRRSGSDNPENTFQQLKKSP